MEKDPLFARTLENESLERVRELAYLRVKKLFEYNFLTENEIFQNPLKHQMLTEALGMYDWSMAAKYQLNVEVTLWKRLCVINTLKNLCIVRRPYEEA